MRVAPLPLTLLILAVALAHPAAATMPEADPPVFDAIFNVPEVQDIALDSGRQVLVAAVAPIAVEEGALSTIVRWSLGPLRRTASWSTDTLVSDLALSPGGAIFAAGQRGGAQANGSPSPRSGSLIRLDEGRPDPVPVPLTTEGGAEVQATIPRVSQVAFDRAGEMYVSAPTQFSVMLVPDPSATPPSRADVQVLRLACGVSAQLSLIEAKGRTAYVSSTLDGASLEAGFFDAADAPAPTCFRVANIFSQKQMPPTLNSVAHALLEDPAGRVDAVLALEPNTGVLHLLRLEGGQQLSRVSGVDLTGAAALPNLLGASRDGSVIWLGARGGSEVLRFRREGDALVRAGAISTGRGLKQIEVSADGSLAALVLRDAAGLDSIHLVHGPGRLPDGDRSMTRGGDTLRRLQAGLNELGYDAGPADGILGPRTLGAIRALEQDGFSGESALSELYSTVEGVLLTRPSEERLD